MLFNSYEFIVFFPIVCFVFFLIPKRFQHLWLLFTSYIFYMCWNIKYSLLLLFITVVTWLCGIWIEKTDRKNKLPIVIGFTTSILLLVIFKYANFLGSTLNFGLKLLGVSFQARYFDIILPVGISFYTFQALSYIVDAYRKDVEVEHDFFRYALFVSFFPQLVAGPIERSKNLLCQIKEAHSFNYERMRDGLLLMIWGYFMKLVIADRAAIYVDAVYSDMDTYPGVYVLFAAILFSIQIYCDFAGYSVIAIGAAKVLGFTLMENFKHPYLSTSVVEFWRNWHISLTSWFRDYLYIPLGGSRKGKIRKYINIMIVFLVSGLWHGAGWHFVIWGGLNGLYQIIEQILNDVCKGIRKKDNFDKAFVSLLKTVWTCVLVGFAWIFFRSDGMGESVKAIKNIIFADNYGVISSGEVFNSILSSSQMIVLLLAIIILLAADMMKKNGYSMISIITGKNIAMRWFFYMLSIMTILIFGIWGPEFSASNFIYFQF